METKKESKQNNSVKTIVTLLFVVALLLISGCAPQSTYQNQQSNQQTNSQTSTQQQTGTQAQATAQSVADATNINSAGDFVSFSSAADFQKFALNHQGTQTSYYGPGGVVLERNLASGIASMGAKSAVAPSAVGTSATGSDSSTASSANDYSQTNVQVAGIDEADSTKSDGKYIYTITDNTVYIINAYPGTNASVVSSFVVNNNTNPSDLLISADANTLVVMGNQYPQYNTYGGWYPQSGESYAYVYDVTDKTNPVLKENLTFEGSYFQARLKDNYVYFVAVSYPEYRTNYPLPVLYKNGVESQIPIDRIFYHPIYDYASPALVQIQSINLADDSVQSTALTVESTQTMYMSKNNIYLSFTQYVNEYQIQQDMQQADIKPYLTADDNQLIDRINSVDADILSTPEKKSKISTVYYQRLSQLNEKTQNAVNDKVKLDTKAELAKYNYFEFTVVNKLSYNNGVVTPVATAKIPGSVNDQFAFDESSEGTLRVATTVHQHYSYLYNDGTETSLPPIAMAADASGSSSGSSGSASGSVASDVASSNVAISDMKILPPQPTNSPTKSQNMVYTFDSNLKEIGSLTGIAVGEQIYAARFDGNRLYLTTFEQVDPFFVIDLSDATKPTIVGQLKLPGFSKYLHPIGNDLVVGLGQAADADTGRVTGLKISLFNVSDVTNPTEIASYKGTDDYAYSTALFDHHAFLLAPQKDLLVIPVEYSDWQNQKRSYAGALVFHIDNSSIALRGLVDHTINGQDVWNAQVERSLYINDELFTKSPHLLRINDLDTLARVKDITLAATFTPGINVY